MYRQHTWSCLTSLLLLLSASTTTSAASNAQWRSRSIYQVLTDRFALANSSTTTPCDTGDRVYCGGTFDGIQANLDYIQGMGFDAIWISPVTVQVKGDTPGEAAYHGYWQQDLFGIEPHFGTADTLKSLSKALHDRGMYLMVDVVVNHNGWIGTPEDVDYSVFNPFNDESYYHPYCDINFDDISNTTNIEQCWLSGQTVPLADLRTEDQAVATGYQEWIYELVQNYSIDGLRVDTVMEVNTDFWSDFVTAAGVYMFGEVDWADPEYVCSFQDYLPGVLNYGTYFPLVSAFSSTTGNTTALAATLNTVKSSCPDTSLLGSFSENHDQPRFAFLTPDLNLAQNVITYTLLADGIPIIYQGQEQHYAAFGSPSAADGGTGNDPYNREALWLSGYNTSAPLYQLVKTLNAVRKFAISNDDGYLAYQNWPIYVDESTIVVRKGFMVSVLTNRGSDGEAYTLSVPAGYAAGQEATELLTCETVTADGEGSIAVPMAADGVPTVYYPTARLAGSGLCGHGGGRKA